MPCGENPDLVLARSLYTASVDENELTIADNGYQDREYFIYPRAYPNDSILIGKIRARHETVNARLKSFKVLSNKFRHSLDLHPLCFCAVANIVQVVIMQESPLFDLF